MKILFICKGNVGRSQIAEGLFNKYIKGDYESVSAGIKISGEEDYLRDLPAENIIAVMKEEGVDVSGNFRKQLHDFFITDADKIFLIIDENDPTPDFIKDNNKNKIIRWNVPDPKGEDLEKTREIKDQIKKLIISTHF